MIGKGKDRAYRCLGPNSNCQHRYFCHFFGMQKALRITTPRKDQPLLKVKPFLEHVRQISMVAWLLSKFITMDKQAISSQGGYLYKQQITYKHASDGFQCNAVCNQSYIYTFISETNLFQKHTRDVQNCRCTV